MSFKDKNLLETTKKNGRIYNKILQTKPSKAVHVLKAGVHIIHGTHLKVKGTH